VVHSRPLAALRTALRIPCDFLRLVSAGVRSHSQIAAENLFLRKQRALYAERQVKPRRADDATRITLVALSWLIDWRRILTVVKPATLIRWHRKGFPVVLALPVKASRKTAIAGRPTAADCGNGGGESNLGEERIA